MGCGSPFTRICANTCARRPGESQAQSGIIDSQSVKSTETSDERGYDAGKKVNGRKRHILVDTIGLLLLVTVLPANLQDRDGARQLLASFFSQCQSARRRVKHIWADGGYAGTSGGVDQETVALHPGNREAKRTPYIQGVATTLGGGADLRLVGALSPAQPRLRTTSQDRRKHGVLGHDSSHARTSRKAVIEFSNRLLGIRRREWCSAGRGQRTLRRETRPQCLLMMPRSCSRWRYERRQQGR